MKSGLIDLGVVFRGHFGLFFLISNRMELMTQLILLFPIPYQLLLFNFAHLSSAGIFAKIPFFKGSGLSDQGNTPSYFV